MKTIILPTDFSDNAWKAMCYAADLYHGSPCKFVLLNTYSFPYQYIEGGIVPNVDALGEDSRADLDKALTSFKDLDHHPDSEFVVISKCNSIVNAIKEIEEVTPENTIIVMGTRGLTGIGELLFGTMTTSVIEHAASPVLCVPDSANLKTPERIGLAVDNEGLDHLNEIKPLLDIAKEWKSNITVIHILEEEKILEPESKERIVIDHFLENIEHNYKTLPGKFKEDELTQFAKTNSIDLITMMKKDKGFLRNLFHTSSTKNMAKYTDIPLLILRG